MKLLKWLVAAILVPGLGVPATKLVESYYDVSIFSSMVAGIGGWMSSVNRLFESDINVRIFAFMVLLMAFVSVSLPKMLSASARRKRMTPYVSPFTPDETAVLVIIGKMTRGCSALESKKVSELTGLSVEAVQRALKQLDHLKVTYSSYDRRGKALVELTPKGRGHFLKLAPFATLGIVPKC